MLKSWVPVEPGSDFPIQNLPFGRMRPRAGADRLGVAIGSHAIDVGALAANGSHEAVELLSAPLLNPFLAAGPQVWGSVRAWLTELLSQERWRSAVEPHLYPLAEVDLLLPFEVADYTDFYSSEHHATNLGTILRPTEPPLMPNWKHLPVGYHGRSGTVAVSRTAFRRPRGQRPEPDGPPSFGPCRKLDIETEVGFVVGVPSELGRPIPVTSFADHVFGVVLVNDWSARDLQAWEYRPLGPFLAKSFLTSISPWVVPLAALESARTAPPDADVPRLPYLQEDPAFPWGLDIDITVRLNAHPVSVAPFATTYWTPAQQLAHMTVNGAGVRTGDLYASGTVSGPGPGQYGSFMEMSWNGTRPLTLPDGTRRSFLEDGDVVTLTASATGQDGTRIGFGSCEGRVLPALT
jgi:fumarylacetoacetase